MSMRDYYDQAVNNLWPKPLPAMTGAEAERAAKRLYEHALGRKLLLPIVLTSGRNNTYIRNGRLRVNPTRGWCDFVHELSHTLHRRLHPGCRPHGIEHGRLERRLIQYVLDHGWLDGRLRPPPPKPPRPAADPRLVKHQRTLEGIKRWTTKHKRATTALRKLAQQKARLERSLAARPPA